MPCGGLRMKWLWRVGLAAIALLWFATLEPVSAESKRVVLLHSFGQDFKPWSEYAKTIRSELQRQSPWQLDITDHSLVTARSRNEDPEVAFVAYLSALFAEQQPDLIVSIGAPAAVFVQRHRPQLFANIPMVFTAVDERRVQFASLSKNDAVVPVRIDYPAAIENILQVLPDTKNVMVVVGTSPTEQFWREEIGRVVKPLTNRVSLTWTNNLSLDDLLKKAAALPPHSAIFWELMIVDAAGVVHEGNTALARLRAVSSAPIFSYDESFFGHEIVGGPLLKVLDSSRQTAAVAVRILGGEKASDIKITPIGFSRPKFDWREMQRWGISESRLPLGSEILFRELTAWERYRWQITSILLALLVQSAMIAWLLVEQLRRRRAETRSRKLSLDVIHLNRAAEAGALSASFAHDLGQPTLAIALNTQRVENLLSKDRPELGKIKEAVVDISRANDHAAAIIKQFRKLLMRGSDPEIQQETDLNAVIADALSILSTEANHRQVGLVAEGHKGPLLVRADPIHVLQVLLNLATNAMDAMADSPSDTRRVVIRTAMHADCKVEVVVSDSGPGIPAPVIDEIFETFYTTKPHGTGLGLSIARTIVDMYGGKIWAENCAQEGAAFHFTIPLSTDMPAPPKSIRQCSARAYAEA
jgi:signal transduction histidine kinase